MNWSKIVKVLVACEFSGIVRDAFIRAGHDAMSCDLLPTESPGPHYEGDVYDVLGKGWDLMIAHPPCTYLANSGVRWLKNDPERQACMRYGALFFRVLLEEEIPRICIENPIIHKYAVDIIGRRQDQIIQPWQFGHGETKAICLWLKNLPKLKPTNIVDGREPRVHHMSPGPDRWKERSRFYTGIAEAMAEQWGSIPPSNQETDNPAEDSESEPS